MRPTRVSFSLFVLLACSDPAPSAQAPSAETNLGETNVAATGVDNAPSVEQGPCALLRAETHAILQEPDVACSTDEECTCYPAFIDCGGVRDDASAQRLIEVDERRRGAACDYIDLDGNPFSCAPWHCVPNCSAGVCSSR